MQRPLHNEPYRKRDVVARAMSGAVFGLFLSYYGLLCFRHQWAADFQMYVAGVARLYANFLEPGHEALPVGTSQSSLYTPYLVAVAGAGRLLDVTPYRALQLGGLVNLATYVAAIGYFFSRYSLHYRYSLAAACFICVSLLLRWDNFGWSSETSLVTFQFIQAYPSTLGWSLGLVSFALVADLRRRHKRRYLGFLVLTLTALLLNHVLTASWVIGVLCVLALCWSLEDRKVRAPLQIVGAIGAALALSFLWPYNSFLGQTAIADVAEPSTFGTAPFLEQRNLYLVALPCGAWLVLRVRQHRVWLWSFVATYAALWAWQLLGISFGNRYAFFMAFFAQFLVAETIAAGLLVLTGGQLSVRPAFSMSRDDKRFVLLSMLASILAALPSPMLEAAIRRESPVALQAPWKLLRQQPPDRLYYARYLGLASVLSADDIVMMPTSRDAFDIAAVTGARFVSAPGALRVSDLVQRFQAANLYFLPRTSAATRRQLLTRYDVTKVILPATHFTLLQRLTSELGPPVYKDGRLALFRVPNAQSSLAWVVHERIPRTSVAATAL